ncbi:MAG: hypothetical protein LBI42_11260 [Chitinispirillales bacterium]|nr:hypothetical protein [Chitinispirillales bacterium]
MTFAFLEMLLKRADSYLSAGKTLARQTLVFDFDVDRTDRLRGRAPSAGKVFARTILVVDF